MLIAALVIALVLLVLFFVVVRTLTILALAVLVALVAGLVAESVAGDRGRNPIFTIFIGFMGALVGTIIATLFGFPRLITIGGLSVIWTVVGAIIVVMAWQAVRPEKT